MTTEIIIIMIAAVSAIASAISAWQSKRAVEYQQTPVLTLEYRGSYGHVIRNIGTGIAKSIVWRSGDIDIEGEPQYSDILIPSDIPLSDEKIRSKGWEFISYPIFFKLNENSEGNIILEYKNLKGKKFISEILISRSYDPGYRVKFLKFDEK